MTDSVRDAIVSKLSAVTGIGQVHSYQRYAAREKQLADLYASNGILLGWFIRRVSVIEKNRNRMQNIKITTWLIRGYMAVDDAGASELVFDGLLDAMREAFKDGVVVSGIHQDRITEGEQVGLSIDDTGPVMFAGVLCHAAKCTLIVQELVTVNY